MVIDGEIRILFWPVFPIGDHDYRHESDAGVANVFQSDGRGDHRLRGRESGHRARDSRFSRGRRTTPVPPPPADPTPPTVPLCWPPAPLFVTRLFSIPYPSVLILKMNNLPVSAITGCKTSSGEQKKSTVNTTIFSVTLSFSCLSRR